MKPSFITSTAFCDMFDVQIQTLVSARCSGTIPEIAFEMDKHMLLVDYKYISRRMEFRRKMWLESHKIYYELMELFDSQSALSRAMARLNGDTSIEHARVWDSWMAQGMFNNIYNGQLVLYPRPKDYLFVRYGRWLKQIHRRMLSDYIYDRR